MKKISVSLATTALLLATSSAWALTYDQSVNANGPVTVAQTSHGNDPGIYYGSGNGNGGWTVDIENNIELGLRTHQRYPTSANTFNSAGNGVYNWTDALGYGPSGQNRSSWNYDFSINVNESGSGAGILSDYTFKLAIDYDPGIGQAWSIIDPLLVPDNNDPYGHAADAIIAQNSENARFAFEGIPGYDNTIAGTYDFVLRAFDVTGALAAQTYIRVNVNGATAGPLTSAPTVPDTASTLMLLGTAVSSLAFVRRKIAS